MALESTRMERNLSNRKNECGDMLPDDEIDDSLCRELLNIENSALNINSSKTSPPECIFIAMKNNNHIEAVNDFAPIISRSSCNEAQPPRSDNVENQKQNEFIPLAQREESDMATLSGDDACVDKHRKCRAHGPDKEKIVEVHLDY